MTAPRPRRRWVVVAVAAVGAAGLAGVVAPAVGRDGPASAAKSKASSDAGTGGTGTGVVAVAPMPSLAEPALSPDGSEIAFVSGGDIWVVPSAGGTAHLLVSHPATESRPVYSPDGKRLAFVSTRTGNGDVYVLTFATGDVARLTYDDAAEQLDGWSRDGRWVYFSSAANDMGASNADVYRVRADGGTPMPVSAERYTNEAQSAPSPDGRALALVAGGNSREWWRNGHSNWNETHVWVRRERKDGKAGYEELTRPGTRELWPMWSADGRTLYCVSDRDGKPQNLVAYDLTRKPDAVVKADAVAAPGAAKGKPVDKPGDKAGDKPGEKETLGAGAGDAGVERETAGLKNEPAGVKGDAINPVAAGGPATAPAVKSVPAPASKPAAAYRDARPVTAFADGRVLWPSISYDGKTIVFERDFALWTLDVSGAGDGDPARSVSPQPLNITLRGSAAAADAVTPLNYTGGFRNLALSPDGRKVAFVVHGEVFAASARDGGRAVRVTHTPAAEGQLSWAPDSRRLAFASPSADAQNLVMYDFAAGKLTTLTVGRAYDSTPRFSPDGKSIAFRRNGTELRLLDVAARTDRLLVAGLAAALPPFDDAAAPYAFSPRGQWLAYIDSGRRGYDNVFVVPTTAVSSTGAAKAGPAKPQQVTFFANTGSNAVAWSPDGRSLLFGTGMRTEDYQLARIDLAARPPNFSEDQFRGLFEEEVRTVRPGGPRPFRPQTERPPADRPAPDRPGVPATPTDPAPPATRPADDGPRPASLDAATRPAVATQPATVPSLVRNLLPPAAVERLDAEQFGFDQVRQRTSLLPVGVDVDTQVVTPDGKWAVLIGSAAGRANVYAYPLDPSAGGGDGGLRQLTTTTGGKSGLCVAPDSKEVYYLDNGQVRSVNLDTRAVREVAVSAALEVDFAQEKREVFREAWTYLKLNFYDPEMHGADWDAVRRRLEPLVAGAKTSDELRRILALMIGELNASHLGVGGSGGRGVNAVGRLGVRWDRAAYEADGVLTIAEVLTNGPAAQAGLKVGDAVLAVDGDPVDAAANLDQLLDRKVGRRVALKVSSPAGAGGRKADEREVAVRPVDAGTEKTLLYRDWVEANRARVAKASGGRLGYVHIADMGAAALVRLNTDLDAEAANREGVVVDIRANLGGFVSPYVLDVLGRRGYLTIGRRGGAESPGRAYVGQRALDLPTVLVTNHQSISDAENFTEGYRALKLGKVVGEPTAGGVIFTSDVTLIDGTVFRIPFSRVTGAKGEGLEGEGRPVDTLVHRRLGETAAGKDTQLDAAVKSLLRQLDRAKAGK